MVLKAKTVIPKTRFSEGIHCIVKTLNVYAKNNQLIESISGYNLIASCLAGMTVTQDLRSGPLAISQGYNKGDATDDTVQMTYFLPLTLSAILGNGKALPLKYFGGLVVEIVLEDAVKCLSGLTLYGSTYALSPLMWNTPAAQLAISNRDASIKDITVITQLKDVVDGDAINVDKFLRYSNIIKSAQWSCAGKLTPATPLASDKLQRPKTHCIIEPLVGE
ncbi:hypothetical protein H9P43_009120 [Blastocladiella emersonii ATCC 22665]|nr:hypothetical protein H9P43_009120 [Blastocladiella emersonii ATCC 22665]